MTDRAPLWFWTIEVRDGDFSAAVMHADPVGKRIRIPAEGRVSSMYVESCPHQEVVVSFEVVAPDRTTAMEQARRLYDEQVPQDMRRE